MSSCSVGFEGGEGAGWVGGLADVVRQAQRREREHCQSCGHVLTQGRDAAVCPGRPRPRTEPAGGGGRRYSTICRPCRQQARREGRRQVRPGRSAREEPPGSPGEDTTAWSWLRF